MIKGATMNHYLLEKSRVVNSTAGERNYHIFYQMCAGATSAQKAKLNLGGPKDYRILNQGSLTVDNVDDAKDFEEVLGALKTVGATQEQIDTMMEVRGEERSEATSINTHIHILILPCVRRRSFSLEFSTSETSSSAWTMRKMRTSSRSASSPRSSTP